MTTPDVSEIGPRRGYLRALFIFVVCAAVLLTGLSSAVAQSSTGVVSGRVLNKATGAYFSGAEVRLPDGRSAFTDHTGAFEISGVPAGEVLVTASYAGLDPVGVSVDVTAASGSRERSRSRAGSTSYSQLRYQNARGTTDIAIAYDVYRKHALFLEVKNLTNEPKRQHVVLDSRISSYSEDGAAIYFGVKGTF